MAASQPANFNLQEFTDVGQLLVGGRLYTYWYGTTTQKTAYTDPDGTVPHTYTADGTGGQYIALNARGELPSPLYLGDGSYDIALKRADGSTVWTRKADGVENSLKSWLATLASTLGASLIGFIQAGVGAVKHTLQDWIRWRTPSIFDFMTADQIAAAKAGGGAFDAWTILQAAFSTLPALEIPAGVTLNVSKELRIKNSFRLKGAGKELVTFRAIAAMDKVIGVYGPDDNVDSLVENVALSGFTVDGAGLAENGLFVSSCLSLNLYNDIGATGCKSWGLNHNRGFTNTARAVRCHDNPGGGYRLGKEVNQCDFDIEADNNGGHGGLVLGADGLRIAGGVENNGAHGLYVYCSEIPNIHGLDIALRYVEDNGTSNKNLYAGIRLETAGPNNIMQGVRIGPLFLNLSGEVGIHVGPNILGLDIGALTHKNSGAQMPLVLTSEYIDLPTAKAAGIRVSRCCSITPAFFSVETAAVDQVSATAEYVFESLGIVPGGEFQPTILTGSDDGRVYGIQKGVVTKVGDRCFFDLTVSMSAKGTSIGSLDIGGLPYASMDLLRNPMSVVAEGLTYTGQLIALMPPVPAAFIRLYSQMPGGSLEALTDAALPETGLTLYVSGSYKIR